MNLVDVILANADRRPDHPALEDRDRVVTYAALRRDVWNVALRLRAAGVREGDLVGVAMGDTVDYVLVMLALFRLGAVMLPVDIRWTAVEKARVLGFFKAATVLVDDPVAELADVKQLVFAELPEPAPMPAAWPGDLHSPLLLSLSSGTTGIPKGPRVTHGQFLMRQLSEWVSLGFLSSDRFLCATPFYFGGGRGFTLGHLIGGATVVLFPPPYDPDHLAPEIERSRITTTFLTPTILRRLLAVAPAHQAELKRLRLLISSGAALHPEERRSIQALITPGFINLYASTEGGAISLLTGDVAGASAESVGRPALMSAFEIVDEADRVLPVGEIGHIRQRAPWLPDGYYENREASAAAFRQGCYYPGDMGRIGADGCLYITGRSKDLIIRGGVNIYPDEVERVLLSHAAVLEAAVVGWSSAEFGEEVAAFVTMRGPLDEAALRTHCKAQLASYKVPRGFFAIAEMPKNSAGKVVKARLREQLTPR